jgi:hypothetical protein
MRGRRACRKSYRHFGSAYLSRVVVSSDVFSFNGRFAVFGDPDACAGHSGGGVGRGVKGSRSALHHGHQIGQHIQCCRLFKPASTVPFGALVSTIVGVGWTDGAAVAPAPEMGGFIRSEGSVSGLRKHTHTHKISEVKRLASRNRGWREVR